MDSFKQLLGKNINEVSLDESPDFLIAKLRYSYKLCGRRYPTEKFRLADIDYFNIISFEDLFKKECMFIIWYNESYIITDFEIYYLSNDFKILKKDYDYIKKTIESGDAHKLREGDTMYLGASRLNQKISQPYNNVSANKRQFVLKKKYLQNIINEIWEV